ncbi:MAG TPA: class I adenylate-forming enzyme family protein [Acidimicrobiia bacterium]|jgi:acyl-CoA synthetase (AMP-forming)/AMP-acid ligase II|nr:class I adenylate-forming enzyme family protein [Acidimicrobiia bacterium]
MPLEGRPLDAPIRLRDVLRVGLATAPDAVAIRSAVDRMTWHELDETSDRLARNYLALGLQPGDRLASLMPNRTLLVVHYLACFKAGLVTTPLNYRYAPPEIEHALGVSGAAALVAHAERGDDLATSARVAELRHGIIALEGRLGDGPTLEQLCREAPGAVTLPDVAPSDPAAIFFTSGSTGPAKGVTHSLETLGWMCASAADAFELTAADTFLPGSSMSHIGSFLWALASFSVGARVVVARTFDAGEILPLLREHRPTVLAMIPAALTALVRDPAVTAADFASLRLCRAGADSVSLELEREFSHLVGFLIDEGYGMTEVGLATLNPPSGLIKQGSIGRPIAGFDICVRDDEHVECGFGTVGRVWIRTRSQTIGYWENPDATAQILRDGWLDSGDLAHADDDGYLWFFGRKKQIIVHDGSNISPMEVEGALAEHPAVSLVGVVGIRDAVHGENVRAYVTVKDGAEPPSSQELIDFARARVGYKAPEEVVFLDQMPVNPTGKLDRVGLKRMAEEHLHPHGLPA